MLLTPIEPPPKVQGFTLSLHFRGVDCWVGLHLTLCMEAELEMKEGKTTRAGCRAEEGGSALKPTHPGTSG